jgi:hypothetical protein
MSPYPKSITQWREIVTEHLPGLSQPQMVGLVLWSVGVQALGCCGQSQVAGFLAQALGQKPNTLRQRLREWTWEKDAKWGHNRQEVSVATCFGPLLKWIIRASTRGEKRLALALDATHLKQCFVVLTVSVLYGGCAIPIAWQVLPATQPGAWRPHWLNLLAHVQGQVPPDWLVVVLADRGLFAKWLFDAIVAVGWHPFLRINSDGKCQRVGGRKFRALSSFVQSRSRIWSGAVICFKEAQLAATLLTYHARGHRQPWLVLTDLPPQEAQITWYGLRSWIEGQFKDIKSGGWQWQRTRMTDPKRVSRLWLVLALALLYSVSLGSQLEAGQPASRPSELPASHVAHRTATTRPQPRRLSLVTQGRLAFLARLILNRPLLHVRLRLPNLWPSSP